MLGVGQTVYKSSAGELVGSGGGKIRVYNLHIVSGAGGNAVATLKSGGSSGTVYATETGTASTGKTFNYGKYGLLFPNGCYVAFDANVVSVVATVVKEK